VSQNRKSASKTRSKNNSFFTFKAKTVNCNLKVKVKENKMGQNQKLISFFKAMHVHCGTSLLICVKT
jgi:hypothetical protein